MIARLSPWPLALAVAAIVAAPAPAREDGRTGDAVVREIDDAKPPRFDPDKREERAYIETYLDELQEGRRKRSGLILELLRVDPKNPRLPGLLPERWQSMFDDPFGGVDELDGEIEEAVEKTGDAGLRVEGAYTKARNATRTASDPDRLVKAVDAFADIAPKGDKRVGGLLFAASERVEDAAARARLEDRILKDFPDAADRVKAARRQREAIGKPFELEFADATTGRTVRMADLKGKVVVVDFWATWCGPCVAEMPAMKKLYAEFQDKGVEFIGVSLDDPEEEGRGLTKLKEYVAEHEIPWPQYYQGKGWQSEFSGGWGINSIPRLFVVGPDGNLFSTSARGHLEAMIPGLLPGASAGEKGGG